MYAGGYPLGRPQASAGECTPSMSGQNPASGSSAVYGRWCEARARLPGDAPAGRIVCGRRLCDDTSVLTLPYLPAYSIIMIALHKVAAPRLDRTAKAADEVAAYERIDSTHAKARRLIERGGSRATMTAASPSPWSPPVPWTTPEDGSAGRGHAFPGTRSPYRSS